MPTTGHCSIEIEGLQHHVIGGITADTQVGIVERETGRNVWIGLLVDGRFFPLVMWKHTVGREYHHRSVEQALRQVEAVIAGLRAVAVMEEAAAAAIGADVRRLSDEELREEITYWAQWEKASATTETMAVEQLLAVLRFELSGRYPPENPNPISEYHHRSVEQALRQVQAVIAQLANQPEEPATAPHWDSDGPGFNDATRHLRDLIEQEVCYPMNLLAVLRTLEPAALQTVEAVFEQMLSEREAIAARRAKGGNQ